MKEYMQPTMSILLLTPQERISAGCTRIMKCTGHNSGMAQQHTANYGNIEAGADPKDRSHKWLEVWSDNTGS